MEIYKDENRSLEERADHLLSLMNLDEKIDEMHLYNDPDVRWKELQNAEKSGKKVDHNFGFIFRLEKKYESFLPTLKAHSLKNTRLGIPLLACGEGLHGFLYEGAVIFPQNIGLACAFNEEIAYEIGKEVGRAARSRGIRMIFAPDIDLAREPRWGRTQETYGEDPYLIGKLGAAYVRGIQSEGVAATLKHYIAYSMPENGLNLSGAHIGEREIRETMLPQYEECVAAGAFAVMPAYNEIDGEPLHSSKKWLKNVLRDELGFDGTIISDWGGVMWNKTFHRMAKSAAEAGKYAIEAGVDVEAPDYYGYGDDFKEAVRRGEIPEAFVNKAVKNILKLKLKLGLFEEKEADFSKKHAPIRTKKGVFLAKKAAEQSITLLKNDGFLPLCAAKKQKIALIGPNAAVAQVGDYCAGLNHKYSVSPLQGLVEKIGEENVIYAAGCGVATRNEVLLTAAVNAAKNADLVVFVLGDNLGNKISEVGGTGGGGSVCIKNPTTNSEGFDVHSLQLPACQKELLRAVKETGKPIVTVLYTGYPRVIKEEFEASNALIMAWYPGEQGGNALAEILYGEVNPSGKLAVSLPQSDGHIPCHYNHRVSSRGAFYRQPGSEEKPGRDYVFASPDAFLPFGYGLSYTKYEYEKIAVKIMGRARAEVKVTLKNAGERDGEETVLLFLKREYAEVVPLEKELKGFRRVKLKAGQRKTVTFVLDEQAFTIIGRDFKKHLNFGKHFVFAGNLKREFTI